jgi:hypothetical protein
MSDMEVDTPAVPKGKKDSREDGKDPKKRFEVKKVLFSRVFIPSASHFIALVECCSSMGVG